MQTFPQTIHCNKEGWGGTITSEMVVFPKMLCGRVSPKPIIISHIIPIFSYNFLSKIVCGRVTERVRRVLMAQNILYTPTDNGRDYSVLKHCLNDDGGGTSVFK